MATQQITTAWIHNNDAEFRTLHKSISDAIKAVGVTHLSAVPGQINFTTVTRPAVANTMAGFELFQIGSFLFRLDYGVGTATTQPLFRFRIGTVHDGNGVIIGINQSSQIDFSSGTVTGATSITTHAISSDNGQSYLVIALNINLAFTNLGTSVLALEQSRDSNGTADNRQLNVFINSVFSSQTASNIRTTTTVFNLSVFNSLNLSAITRKIGIFPQQTTNLSGIFLVNGIRNRRVTAMPNLFPLEYGGDYDNAGITTRHFYTNDLTPLLPVIIKVRGTDRTYIPLPFAAGGILCSNENPAQGMGTAIIWE